MSRVKEYTPIRPKAGGLTHATCIEDPRRTVCGKKCDGWVVEPSKLTCVDCNAGIHLPVKADSKVRVR